MVVNDRIRLISMPDDPCPIPPGATGTITSVFPQPAIAVRGAWCQYGVKWDAPHEKRSLSLCVPPDEVEVIRAEEQT